LLNDQAPQVSVLPMHWPAFLQRFAGNAIPPVFKKFADQKESGCLDIPPFLKKLSDTAPKLRFDVLSRYLADRVSHVLGLTSAESLIPGQPLKELGLDSLMAVEFNNIIQNDLIVGLTAEHFMENPSIHGLAASLLKILEADGFIKAEKISAVITNEVKAQKQTNPKLNGWIAYRKPKPDPAVNLFCFHHMGGAASLFRGWGDALPKTIDICPVQLPGREGRRHEKPIDCFDLLIDTLSDSLLPYLNRPFALFGHSMGSWIAFELVHSIRLKHGKSPEHLFVAAMPPPSMNDTLFNGVSMDESWIGHMEIPDALKKNEGFMNEWTNLFKADSALFQSHGYVEKPLLDCPITALGGTQDTLVTESQLSKWKQHTANRFHVESLKGGHMFPTENKIKLLDIIGNNLLWSGKE
jgi:medium-chain acyl-[acyl-carrier-protein] hydrolase